MNYFEHFHIHLDRYFSAGALAPGASYARTDQVITVVSLIDGASGNFILGAKVRGRQRKPYQVSIHFDSDEPEGRCSCPRLC